MIDKRLNSLKRSMRIKCGRGMPHYIQIYEGVQYCLENNHWKAGEKFGNLEELAELFGVSRLTVKHAIKPFLEKGILISKRGKGLFVNVVFDEPPRMTFRTDWGAYTKLVEDTKIIILESDRRTECPWDLSEFKSFPPSYQYLMKVHSKREKPYGVIETYFDAELFDLSPRIYAEEVTLMALERIKPNTVHEMKQKIMTKKKRRSHWGENEENI